MNLGRRGNISRKSLTKIRIGPAAWSNPPAERGRRMDGESHLEHYAARFNALLCFPLFVVFVAVDHQEHKVMVNSR